ncbi:SGNH/GDSL hydrolase family protein [Reyranella sp.]|uniref:SGNH/GDSL hydrolase family protein n=1 Tax=Reyranella sp. TaxID=1929291 RepID=UPI003D0B2A55
MKVIRNGLLLVAVLALCLLSFEGLTRVFLDDGMLYELEMWKYATDVKVRDPQPDIGHRHRSGAQQQLMGVSVRTNSLGLRSPEIDQPAKPGVARIAFVGDSITLGWGVAEQETFANRVLDALTKAGRKVDGFNLGVGNYNTTQELALYRKVGARLKPDIIVLAYFINDAEPMPLYLDTTWLDRNSAGWNVLRYRLDTVSRTFGETPDWKKYYRDLYAPNAAGWEETRKALGNFAAEARQTGAKLIVFNIPELRELKPYPFGDITDKVRAVIERDKVPFVDLLPSVESVDPRTLWVTVPDPHPNGKADAYFAKGMLPEITSLLDGLCRDQGKGC